MIVSAPVEREAGDGVTSPTPLTLPSPPMGERDVQGPGPDRLAITMAAY